MFGVGNNALALTANSCSNTGDGWIAGWIMDGWADNIDTGKKEGAKRDRGSKLGRKGEVHRKKQGR